MSRLRRLIAIAAATMAGLAGNSALAEGPLRELITLQDAKGWEAVGRINIAGAGYCTGALIEPSVVLTAAHCLYHPTSGRPVAADDFQFLAGWRNGRAMAYRTIRRVVAHPSYVFDGTDKVDKVAFDVALLELAQPIRHPSIRPFGTADRPERGEAVGIVSYATGRDEAPSLEEVCKVLAREQSVLMLSCSVDFGSSGAPIFRMQDGEARIVSIVAAKAEVAAQNVALAAELGGTLETVRGLLGETDGVFHRTPPVRRAEPEPTPLLPNGGAKFVRP